MQLVGQRLVLLLNILLLRLDLIKIFLVIFKMLLKLLNLIGLILIFKPKFLGLLKSRFVRIKQLLIVHLLRILLHNLPILKHFLFQNLPFLFFLMQLFLQLGFVVIEQFDLLVVVDQFIIFRRFVLLVILYLLLQLVNYFCIGF